MQISKYARVQQLREEVTKVTDENCYFRGLGKMDGRAGSCLFVLNKLRMLLINILKRKEHHIVRR